MKYKLKIISQNLFIFILPLFLWPGFAIAVADDDFGNSFNIGTLAEGEILVIKLDGGDRNLISGRVVGVVDAPIDTVWAVLSDYNSYQQFMPRLDVTYMVDRDVMDEFSMKEDWTRPQFEALLSRYRTDELEGEGLYYYNVLDIPFPMADLWFLLKMVRNPSLHRFSWSLVYGNMLINEGAWELKSCSTDDSTTLVSYTTSSDPGVNVPHFLENLALRSTLPNTIESLRERVRQLNVSNKY
jgi:hypothetical protein